MQPLTSKELQYMTDSMSNEELLVKQFVSAAVQSQTPAVRMLCNQLADRHMQHYQHLMSVLHQHANLAPTQPQ